MLLWMLTSDLIDMKSAGRSEEASRAMQCLELVFPNCFEEADVRTGAEIW